MDELELEGDIFEMEGDSDSPGGGASEIGVESIGFIHEVNRYDIIIG